MVETTLQQNEIVVQVDRIMYRKEDSGWTILRTTPQSISDPGLRGVGKSLSCLGVVSFEVNPGDSLKLQGRFQTSSFNGEQEFKFTSAMPHMPEDMVALLHYAVSITKGLGEIREAEILATYGSDWIKQERLEISGIPERVQVEWALTIKKINEHKAQTQAMTFLIGKGCTMNMAVAAWNEWKEKTTGIVSRNPYALAELPHFGFKIVDTKIRYAFDIADNDPRRLEAAIMYEMGQLTNGSTVVQVDQLRECVQELIPCTNEEFKAAIERLDEKIMELEDEKITISNDYENEAQIYETFFVA